MSVKSVHKALQVLEAVAKEPGGITVREVSERLNFPYATAHRLLQTLKKAGYVEYESTEKVYRIGPQLINLYRPAPHLADLGRLAYPYLSRLSAEAQETAHLATRSGHEVIYLDTVLPQSSFVMYTPVGARAPVHSTALGKAMVAFLPDQEIHELLQRYTFQKLTPNTIESAESMWREIEAIRSRGFAFDREESTLGVRCVASVVVNRIGYPVAAISVSTASHRLQREEAVNALSTMVCAACRNVSRAIGGNLGPDPELWFREVSGR